MLILASHLSYMQDSFATKLLQLFFFLIAVLFSSCVFFLFFPLILEQPAILCSLPTFFIQWFVPFALISK